MFGSWASSSTSLFDVANSFNNASNYRRCYVENFLQEGVALSCFLALSNIVWKRNNTDWFTQEDFVFRHRNSTPSPVLSQFYNSMMEQRTTLLFRKLTGINGLCNPSLAAHKMSPGDYVDVHNDYVPGGDRLRCILYLGENKEHNSGLFVAYGDEEGRRPL